MPSELEQLRHINALLRKEKDVYEESARHWRVLCEYAYQRSSAALMTPAALPRQGRIARDQALSDINKRLGGALR